MSQAIHNPAGTPAAKRSFTGVARRKTRRSVKVIDLIAKYGITIGGLSVTIAFLLIVASLVLKVTPLFGAATLSPRLSVQLPAPEGQVQGMLVDEYLNYLWTIDRAGQLSIYRVAGGELVRPTESLSTAPVSAVAVTREFVALGHKDGTIKVGQMGVKVDYIKKEDAPDAMESLPLGQTMIHQGGVVDIQPETGLFRVFNVTPNFSDALKVGDGASPVVAVDYMKYTDKLEGYVALREDGRLFFGTIAWKGLGTRKKAATVEYELPVAAENRGKKAVAAMIGSNARVVYVAYADGLLLRYNTDDPAKFKMSAEEKQKLTSEQQATAAGPVEQVDLVPDPSAQIASIKLHMGSTTLIVTDTRGNVSGWFAAPFPADEKPTTADWLRMVKAHELANQGAAVTSIATSSRDRQFLTVDASGKGMLRHMTSEATQLEFKSPGNAPIQAAALAPNNSALAILDHKHQLTLYNLNNPHPEISWDALFGKVHYENYSQPEFVYQTTSAGVDAEPKFSMIPLIWGTLKATLYAMIFAVPIAILAAIYTSEFMQPNVRAVVKPTIELMASLPSVVLGFIAALVFASLLQNWLMAVLAMFVAIPAGLAAFGFFWQLLPVPIALRVPPSMRFLIMMALVALTGYIVFQAGPLIEQWLFSGDIREWLGKAKGGPAPGWAILLTPIFILAMVFFYNGWIKPRIRDRLAGRSVMALGGIEIVRFVIIAGLAMVMAYGMGVLLGAMGLDLRSEIGGVGSFVGGYVKLNSLLLGIFMGFAIIPLIYTVSEDALVSVPASLRSASLGAGATPWQTAIRVVLPVATSGIFSACMIGFGRAAGETMIVLMASGNTSVMDVNIFNGLRALSANIATEMPEAARDSTHFRLLFFSGLLLFGMTFIVNTVAEVVRIRFRKRAYQL